MFTTQCLLFYGVIYWCCLQIYFLQLAGTLRLKFEKCTYEKLSGNNLLVLHLAVHECRSPQKLFLMSFEHSIYGEYRSLSYTCIALGVGLVPVRSLGTGKSLCLVSTIQLLDMTAEFMELFHDSQGLGLTCTSKEAVELYNYVLENFVSTNNEYMSKLELALQLESRFVMAQCFMVSLFLVTCWNRTLAQRARGTA